MPSLTVNPDPNPNPNPNPDPNPDPDHGSVGILTVMCITPMSPKTGCRIQVSGFWFLVSGLGFEV